MIFNFLHRNFSKLPIFQSIYYSISFLLPDVEHQHRNKKNWLYIWWPQLTTSASMAARLAELYSIPIIFNEQTLLHIDYLKWGVLIIWCIEKELNGDAIGFVKRQQSKWKTQIKSIEVFMLVLAIYVAAIHTTTSSLRSIFVDIFQLFTSLIFETFVHWSGKNNLQVLMMEQFNGIFR